MRGQADLRTATHQSRLLEGLTSGRRALERSHWLDLFTDKTWDEFLAAGGAVSCFREGRRALPNASSQGTGFLATSQAFPGGPASSRLQVILPADEETPPEVEATSRRTGAPASKDDIQNLLLSLE
jgi:hypothetical protein